MQKFDFREWFWGLSIAAIGFVAVAALAADRTVVIMSQSVSTSSNSFSGKITLTNPSSVAVNYNVTCYKENGSLKFSSINETLNSLQRTNFGTLVGGCSGGSSFNYTNEYSNGAGECYLYDSYPNVAAAAGSQCGAGFTVCSHADWKSAVSGSGADSRPIYVTGLPSGTAYSAYGVDNGGGWSANNQDYVAVPAGLPTQRCADTAVGGGNVYTQCRQNYALGSNSYYVSCCPDTTTSIGQQVGPVGSCKVTITSGGHLSSPEFKASAPF